jgi:hypothetical protein
MIATSAVGFQAHNRCSGAETHMKAHKFKPGQFVRIQSARSNLAPPGGRYEIVRQLPPENNDFQYRVRSTADNHERVVRESELT